MAAASPLQDLQERVMCPICLEPFKDPVVTPCGHNFCRPCFQGYLEGPWARVDFRLQSMVGLLGELSVQQEGTNRGPGAPLCCPKCQTPCLWADLRPNTELQNMVAVMRHLSVLQERHPMGGGVCVQHEEKLKLFCQDDHKLICVICQVSGEHEKHRVRPVSEAAQEYQAKLQNLLLPLKKERKEIVSSRQKEEEEYKDLRKHLEAERVEIIADFQHFRQLLREEEQTILRRLEEMDRKITMVENASIAKLYNQISSLDSLIKEIETKCKQPPEELLKDVGLTLSRCEKVRFHGPDLINKDNSNSENLKLQTYNDEEKNIACGNMNIVHPGDVKRYKVLVTLDPETAHQSLFLSENEQRVTRLHKMQFEFSPSNAKRFTASSCVLGRNGFSSGKHYWEVQLLQEELGWTVGIAHESVNRNLSTPTPQRTFGFNYFGQTSSADRFGEGHPESPAVGVLAVHGDNGRYVALTSPCTILKPLQPPKKLGVYLDCEQVQVSLYNGDTMELLYTLNGISFTGKVYPYFNLTGNNYAGRMLGIATDLRLV